MSADIFRGLGDPLSAHEPAPDVVGLTATTRDSNGDPHSYRVRCPACGGDMWVQVAHFSYECHGCHEYRAHYTTVAPGWRLEKAS